MVLKRRSPGNTAIGISLSEQLLDEIDARAKRLGLNRSQYFSLLAKNDLDAKAPIELKETPPPYGSTPTSPVDLAAQIVQTEVDKHAHGTDGSPKPRPAGATASRKTRRVGHKGKIAP